jgi:RNA polymerase sigma factor (sigma-70 family)
MDSSMDSRPDLDSLASHVDALRALARHLVSDVQAAEDLVQDACVAAVAHPPAAAVPLRAWLVGVVRNLARRRRRDAVRRVLREQAIARTDASASFADAVERAETHRIVVEELLALQEPYRATLVRRFFDGVAPRVIAAELGVPVGTVGTRLSRGLAMLRARLERRLGEGRDGWRAALILLQREPRRGGRLVPLTVGVLAMTTKKWVATVLIAALLAGGWAVWQTRPQTESTSDRASGAVAPRASERSAREAPRPPVRDETVPASAPRPPAAVRVRGRILDDEGNGIAGARVLVLPGDANGTLDLARAKSTTAAGGLFEVDVKDLPPPFVLAASAEGYGLGMRSEVSADVETVIVLERSATLVGRVLDGDGRPIAGAHVRVGCVRVDPRTFGRGLEFVAQGVSQADGTYRVEGLPAVYARPSLHETMSMLAAADGFAQARLPVPDLQAGRETRLDVRLSAGMTLDVVVMDDASGARIPKAHVGLASFGLSWGKGDWRIASAVTGDDGTVRFEHVPASGDAMRGAAGGCNVCAWKEGFCPAGANVPRSPDGSVREATLRLTPASTVVGRVVTREGKPLERRLVTAVSGDPRTMPSGTVWVADTLQVPEVPGYAAWTDVDGRYRIPGVRTPGGATTANLSVSVPGDKASVAVEVHAGETATAPDIVLNLPVEPDLGHADVLVVTAEGRPVAGAAVSNARTDADGHARVANRPAIHGKPEIGADDPLLLEPVELFVRRSGFATRPITLTFSREDRPAVRVELSAGHCISGRVLRADGSPASNAAVFVLRTDASADAVFSGRDFIPAREGPVLGLADVLSNGTFRVEDLPDGPYQVVARARGSRPGAFQFAEVARAVATSVPTDARGVVLNLPPEPAEERTFSLTANVVDAETGQALDGASGRMEDGVDLWPARGDAKGVIRFDHLTAGEWRMRVVVEGYAIAYLTGVRVTPEAESAPVTVRMVHGTTVEGTVRADGRSVTGGRLVFMTAGHPGSWAEQGQDTVVAADGTYRMPALRPGRYRLVYVDAAERRVVGSPCDVPPGETQVRRDAVFERPGELLVFAKHPRLPESTSSGEPSPEDAAFARASRIDVVAEDGDVVASVPIPRAGSPAQLSAQLAPGTYVARFVVPGEPIERRVAVVAGETARVTLEPR